MKDQFHHQRLLLHLKLVKYMINVQVLDSNILPSWDLRTNPPLSSSSQNSSLDNDVNCQPANNQRSLFEVTGYEVMADEGCKTYMKQFQYLTKNVVLATGKVRC